MADEKFLIVSLDDEKSKAVAEVLASKTCKKIINYLAENKEASEKDLADKLQIPINTVEYNLKKLISSGFVQKRKNFFWSRKGKKIIMYEISNRSIVISHKKSSNVDKIKSITPAIILTAAGTFAIWAYQRISSIVPRNTYSSNMPSVAGASPMAAQASPVVNAITSQPLWQWFLFGGLLAIFIIAIINWRKL